MAQPTTKGDPAGPSNLGAVNMKDRGLHFGVPAAGATAGPMDEAYGVVNLTASGVVTVPHSLGRVPNYARVVEVTSGPSGDLHASVTSVNKSSWTATTVQVRVTLTAGSIVGGQLTLLVG